MKDKVYASEIAQSVKDNNISNYYPFRCSICDEIYGYYFIDDKVIFDGACGCSSIFDKRETDYEEIADIYNRNIENEEFRKEFLNHFKLEV